VWSLNPFARGTTIEQQLGQNLPQNFPVIDIFDNGMATSIKSLNVDANSYQSTATLSRTLSGYIDSVAGYNGTGPNGWANVIITPSQITGRSLDLVIPNSGSTAQQQAINQAVQYGLSKGVTVNVIVHP
jgi:filamentous hemagglutinin